MKCLSCLIIAGISLFISGCVYFMPTAAGINAAMGVEAGVPSLPYYAFSKEALLKLNTEMMEYNTPFTLADTFKAVYGTELKDFNPTDYNEQLFTNMKEATTSFQKLLRFKNIPDADYYLLTSVDSAEQEGLMLFAAVFRPARQITVADKYDVSMTRTLTPADLEFYRPYRADLAGNRIDTVYEWAALPVDSYSRQSRQAVLLALSANKVFKEQSKPDYWEKEKEWLAGNHNAVATAQDQAYCDFLGVKKGFTCD